MSEPFQPHDLLWVAEASDVMPIEKRPAWVTPEWIAVAPAVVRRAPWQGDGVPVGLRGTQRHERCAALVAAARLVRRVTPVDIARGAASDPRIAASTLACLRTLARLAGALDALPLPWGVTGGVGFTLASGIDVLRIDSDLDLWVHAPYATDAEALRALAAALHDAELRVDVQVETGCGGFALNEWLRTGGPVLLRTAHGPVLRDDPWLLVAA